MKPTHPVDLIACAIATQEGWFVNGSTPQNRNNPGDLRFAGQIGALRPASSKPSEVEPIAQFPSKGLGTAALYRQLWKMVAEGRTVTDIISVWAPPSENNTSQYLSNVLAWTGLAGDVPVLELLPALIPLNQVTT